MKPCEYECGTEVRFVLLGYDEERKPMWSAPMESLTREVKPRRAKGFEVPDLVVTERFTHHRCAEGDRAREERRAQQQQRHAMHQDFVRKSAAAWDEALKRACPKCEAAPGCRCINMSDWKRNISPVREIRYPHKERLPEGWEPPP